MLQIREVPNHQEFFSDSDTGLNVIFEINEVRRSRYYPTLKQLLIIIHQKHVQMQKIEDSKSAKFFFENLAEDNDAKALKIHTEGQSDANCLSSRAKLFWHIKLFVPH